MATGEIVEARVDGMRRPTQRLMRAVRYGRRVAGYYGRVTAARLHLVRSWTGYGRFLIVGKGRTGTNFLRLMLDDHPAVIAHGELFREHDRVDSRLVRPLQSSRALRQKLTDPVEFIEEKVFRPLPRSVGAVGFKLFYYHAREPDWRVVWDHLQRDDRVKVLHMTRRDDLATLVSLQRAQQSGNWVGTSTADLPRLTLTPEECEEAFRGTLRWREDLASAFPPERVHEVVYEDLVADPSGIIEGVQRFLGLEVEALTAGSVRQSSGPTADAVANYEELRSHFSGTLWEAWLGG